MRNRLFFGIFIFLVLAFFLFLRTDRAVGETGKGKPHPTLVNPETAKCTTCHEDTAKKKYVHSAVKESGCVSCHEIKKVGKKTMVDFVEKRSSLCFTCHSEIKERASKKHAHPTLGEWCELCHTPHSSDNASLLTASMAELCANCHEIGEEKFKSKHGRQPVALLGCSGCHDSHGSDQVKMLKGKFNHVPFGEGECNACHKRARGKIIRLRGLGAKLCYACHSDQEEEFSPDKTGIHIHPPIKKEGCTGCHDPHLSEDKALLKGKGNRLCLGCHGKVGSLLKAGNVHPPAEESCRECHAAHTSKHAFLLKEEVVTLCLNCHDTEGEGFIANHYQQEPRTLLCTECHNPHGSKNKKLINTYSHAPFLEKECDACHEAAQKGKKIKLVEEEINALCLTCHDDKANDDTKKGLFPHGVLEVDNCTACHSAHASARDYILKDHTSRLCVTCHEEREKERKAVPFIHPIIDSIGCEACHDSHFSKNEKLLVEEPNRLCLACHLREGRRKEPSDKEVTLFGRVKLKESELLSFKKILLSSGLTHGHPQRGHPVSGTVDPKNLKNKRMRGLTFSGAMNCLSCHDAHAGGSPQFFVDQLVGRFRLCLKCHAK